MNTNPEVDAWFAEYEHPVKDAMLAVRETVLSDGRMSETIKWKSPTFMYKDNMASFNLRTKAHVSLLFHTGATIPGDHPRLIGGGKTARYMTLGDLADVESARVRIAGYRQRLVHQPRLAARFLGGGMAVHPIATVSRIAPTS